MKFRGSDVGWAGAWWGDCCYMEGSPQASRAMRRWDLETRARPLCSVLRTPSIVGEAARTSESTVMGSESCIGDDRLSAVQGGRSEGLGLRTGVIACCMWRWRVGASCVTVTATVCLNRRVRKASTVRHAKILREKRTARSL